MNYSRLKEQGKISENLNDETEKATYQAKNSKYE